MHNSIPVNNTYRYVLNWDLKQFTTLLFVQGASNQPTSINRSSTTDVPDTAVPKITWIVWEASVDCQNFV